MHPATTRRLDIAVALLLLLACVWATGVLAIVDRLSMLCERLASEGAEPAGEDGDVIASLSGDAPDPVQADAAPAVPAAIRMRRDDDIITELQGWRSIRVPLPLLDSVMAGVTDIVLARQGRSAAEMAGILAGAIMSTNVVTCAPEATI